ncbi:bifunctional DNA-formamidopyrimidine glycosylase/DNA-(apurinic or apyrimidinic site) lyase [Tanticharoenia sakaeratensis]|nr:bifunctional DNA-formamidopyrimidine glycosylase/DNA-(apurinic or apyrimidinic site) lyase [Tanticharoenia sakaeratensis]GBQ20622.1 formamidopyrimidine-DNA glycosylase [Tanticharoenia sakaeratensis NBRC 103193]
MPELPEVETIMRAMRARLEGQEVAHVLLRRADLRWPIPPALPGVLTGRRIEGFARRGKYILMRIAGGQTMLWHLGMSGRIGLSDVTTPNPDGKDAQALTHEHVVLRTVEGTRVGLTDPRRFGAVDLVTTAGEETHKLLAPLGIEPLSRDFNAKALGALLAGRRTPIKAALLDQRLIAGLGNIYVCEALYRAGIHPARLAGSLAPQEVQALAKAVPPVLQEAISAGGSSLRDYRQPDGELGYFQTAWRVYGREGEGCPTCPGMPDCPGVQRIVQSGRSTFFCPRRQTP